MATLSQSIELSKVEKTVHEQVRRWIVDKLAGRMWPAFDYSVTPSFGSGLGPVIKPSNIPNRNAGAE